MSSKIDSLKFFITGTRRGLGKELTNHFCIVDSLFDCDVFINNKHDGFKQVEMLYDAAKLGKQIINIGSHASDFPYAHRYAVEKKSLREANHQLFIDGVNTSIVNFGYFDSLRSKDYQGNKLPIQYCVDIIKWIIEQPHRIKDITCVPK